MDLVRDAAVAAGMAKQHARCRHATSRHRGRPCSKRIIDFSLRNKFIVLLATLALVLGGIYARAQHPAGRHPRPVGHAGHHLHRVAGPGAADRPGPGHVSASRPRCFPCRSAKVVRGYSFYGFSFVYVIFEDGTDPYWARSRVLEYLSGLSAQSARRTSRPRSARTPPASAGRSCIRSTRPTATWPNCAPCRTGICATSSPSVEGVSEVASVGGFVKQYQVTVDPTKLRAYNLSISEVRMAIERSNGEVGGRSIEMAEKEFILRVRGYIQNLDDLRKIAVGVGRERRADSAGPGGQRATRPGHAARHRRAERRRRDRRRHRRRALRRQRAPGHSRREEAARPGDEGPAAGRDTTPSPTTAAR